MVAELEVDGVALPEVEFGPHAAFFPCDLDEEFGLLVLADADGKIAMLLFTAHICRERWN